MTRIHNPEGHDSRVNITQSVFCSSSNMHTEYLTYSIKQSSWWVDSCLPCWAISHVLWKSQVNYLVHKILQYKII